VNVQPPNPTSTQEALLTAFGRLRSGQHSGVTNGRLTMANVALEAGRSRASAYRCSPLVSLFAQHDWAAPAKPKPRSATIEEKHARKESRERELRLVINQLLHRILAMQSREKHLLEMIAKLNSALHEQSSTIVPLRKPNG
jgi:hypothetical protein